MLTVEILERQNKRLREENDELRETIRSLLARTEDEPLPTGMPRFTAQEELVVRLTLFKGAPISRERIYRALHDDSNRYVIKTIDVIMHKIRRKLDGTQFRLCSRRGDGWWIEHDMAEGRLAA